jgi:uncharacterized protein YndB with AHSA1/START domain
MRITHEYSASADRIYDAWLDPKKAAKFLFATPTGQMVRAEIDPRAGGRFVFVDRRHGEDVLHQGRYLELERPRRIVFTLSVPKYSEHEDQITIEIKPREHGCELTLTQELRPEFRAMEEKAKEGWSGILDLLEEVEPGDDPPSCGSGLAQHASRPLRMAEMLAALGETLELHRAMLILDDKNSKREDDVYHELATAYDEVAAKLKKTAEQTAKQRDLPMGAHDETKWSDAHLRSFTRFVKAQSALLSILRVAAENDEKMLASMTAES